MKIALVANPRSGGKSREGSIQMIRDRLRKNGIRSEIYMTRYHGHAVKIVQRLVSLNPDAIVAAGGDGTNYQVVNGLLKNDGNGKLPPVGLIPLGRGNSFARDLSIFSIQDGIDAIIGQHLKTVDVCRFSQNQKTGYFVNLLGMGFVTDVARTALKCRWAGDAGYVIGVIYRTLGLRFHEIVIDIDGHTLSGRNCFVEVCNSRFTGGEMMMAPEAKIDDGWFDVVVAAPLSRISLIATLPKIFKGTHGTHSAVRFIRGQSAKISTRPTKQLLPDGEIYGRTPVEIRLIPRLMRFFHLPGHP